MIDLTAVAAGGPQVIRGPRFATVIPVGPDPLELARAVAVVRSLLHWEPGLAWCVFIDDSHAGTGRGLSELNAIPTTCRAITLLNPCQRQQVRLWGRLTAGILTALSWVQSNTDAEFVLKIDTDALVISPFAEAVRALLAREPDVGIVGAMGLSCNPEIRAKQDYRRESRLLIARRILGPTSAIHGCLTELEHFPGPGRLTENGVRAFALIRPHIDAAVSRGYCTLEYCQGGAYIVSRRMIDWIAQAGYLINLKVWEDLPFGEDTVMGMYARAVGLQIRDYSDTGEPFGVQYRGLPYRPEELVTRGYSIIHSLKDDPYHSETEIRNFFHRYRVLLENGTD